MYNVCYAMYCKLNIENIYTVCCTLYCTLNVVHYTVHYKLYSLNCTALHCLAKGNGHPQELKESPSSGLYHLVLKF